MLQLLSSATGAGKISTSINFYKGLIEVTSDNSLGVGDLGFNKDQLTDLFRMTFGPKYLDNFQKSLT